MSDVQLIDLPEAITQYKKHLSADERAFALLYSPTACHLVLVDRDGKFHNHNGGFEPEHVFEARIFNAVAELRWLHESDGKGRMAIISDSTFADNQTITQTYLLWGKKVELKAGEKNPEGWTRFGTARIGAFYVPIADHQVQEHASFQALEYLQTFEDGNVAVVDERLTGIRGYKPE